MAVSFDSEKDFEDFVFENEEWFKAAFNISDHDLYRQVNLGPYGIADIVATHEKALADGCKFLDVMVFELKNTQISHTHLSQIARYLTFFDRMTLFKGIVDVAGVLIGKKTFPNEGDLCYLCQNQNRIDVCEFDIDPVEGMTFHSVRGWHMKSSQLDAEASLLGAVCDSANVKTKAPELKAV